MNTLKIHTYKSIYVLSFDDTAHYYNCILDGVGINSTFGNPTYTSTAQSKGEIPKSNASVLNMHVRLFKTLSRTPILVS
jgi:hypothetical protein